MTTQAAVAVRPKATLAQQAELAAHMKEQVDMFVGEGQAYSQAEAAGLSSRRYDPAFQGVAARMAFRVTGSPFTRFNLWYDFGRIAIVSFDLHGGTLRDELLEENKALRHLSAVLQDKLDARQQEIERLKDEIKRMKGQAEARRRAEAARMRTMVAQSQLRPHVYFDPVIPIPTIRPTQTFVEAYRPYVWHLVYYDPEKPIPYQRDWGEQALAFMDGINQLFEVEYEGKLKSGEIAYFQDWLELSGVNPNWNRHKATA